MRSILKTLFSITIVFMLACSPTVRPNNVLIMRLKNRGPVPLSSDNPYLAANALLSKEMENSSELKGFLKHRGAPAALEVNKEVLSPLTMQLYYPDKLEYYSLEDTEGAWLINGPYKIDRVQIKELEPITKFSDGKAAITFPPDQKASANLNFPEEQPEEEITATREEIAEPIATEKSESPKPLAAKVKPSVPAISAAPITHPAELTPKGDLVHYVVSSLETLEAISIWYTGDASNAERLARINKLSPSAHLTVGDSVIIPSYLVKNKNRMPDTPA